MNLTREQILNEPAGRQMDAWIAEYVMGWKITVYSDGHIAFEDGSPYGRHEVHFKPSTNIAVAWEVVEKFAHRAINKTAAEMGFSAFGLTAYPSGGWECRIGGLKDSPVEKTVPLAICRAALLAVMEGVQACISY